MNPLPFGSACPKPRPAPIREPEKSTAPWSDTRKFIFQCEPLSEIFTVMDDIDRKIAAHIQHDGRASYADIGAAVGLSVSAVNERLKKLQSSGAIQGWSARMSPKALGLDVLAFVEVLLERPEHDAPFRAAVLAMPAVQECHHVTGEWSYLLKVRVADTEALERFLSNQLKTLPGVARSHTVIALSSVKETALLPTE